MFDFHSFGSPSKTIVVSPTPSTNEGNILSRASPISSKKNSVQIISRNWQPAHISFERWSFFGGRCGSSTGDKTDRRLAGAAEALGRLTLHCVRPFDPADGTPSLAHKLISSHASTSDRPAMPPAKARQSSQTRESCFSAKIDGSAVNFAQFNSAVCCVSFGSRSISRRIRLSPSEQSSNSSLRWRRIGACSRDSSSSA